MSIRPGPVKARAKSRRCQAFSPMWTLVGVELGVDPAERVERRTLDTGLGRGGDLPQCGLDVIAVRPSVGFP